MPVLLRSEVEPLSFPLDTLEKNAHKLLHLTGHDASELSILLVDDDKITELNSSYRGKDKATNVLSFPMDDDDDPGPKMLGDIIISVDTATREAKLQEKTVINHLAVLLVHGFVHLLGFDHEQDEEAANEMKTKENELLQIICTETRLHSLSG